MWTLRFLLLAILNWIFPVEKPSEGELIAYGREQERQKNNPLESPEYIEQIRTQRIAAINAEQAQELQGWIDRNKDKPRQDTEPIRLHAIHLKRISTYEMPCAFPTPETDKWLIV